MIGLVIASIFKNLYVVLFAIAVVTAIAKMSRQRREGRPVSVAYTLWGEVLFYSIGIDFLYTGIFHAYFQQIAAPSIGWAPSPFEYELGWMEIPVAVVALMALWRGYEFRLAATIVAVTFALAAAAQHINEMVCCHNYAPNNAGLILWFADIFVPLVLIVLAALSRRGQIER